MRNLKHTIAAIAAVSLVGSLAAVQAVDFSAATATKLTQETEDIVVMPEVLEGDGDGVTAEFTISPARQMFVGKDGYILTEGGSINLRAAADTESTIINVLELGDQIKIIDIDEDWFKIEAGEYTGYVKSEFVTLEYDKVKAALIMSVMYQSGTAVQSINVRGTADENAIILDQVPQGGKVIILETTDNGWHRVYFGDNYDIGYVSAEYITVGDMVERDEIDKKRADAISKVSEKGTIKTSEQSVAVKLLPSEESETLTTLANGASCKIVSGGTNWTKIIVLATNEIGYVRTANVEKVVPVVQKPEVTTEQKTSKTEQKTTKTSGKTDKSSSAIAAPAASGSGAKLVQEASKYIGTRYVYGGTSPSGFDCSGLVQYCLRKYGISVPRSSSSQYSCGTSVSKSNLQAGDLVFFGRGRGISHVAIYAGNGMVIHAPRAGKSVCYQSLSTLSSSLTYVGARRVM